MIVTITGTLERATPLSAVINTAGLGYLVNVPVGTASQLPAIGERVTLHTHAIYREDSQALYGFASEEERDFFALLIEKVSGVGPKVGISLMSKLELPSLVEAIASGDAVLLAKTPGIGKKTAERVVVELKDKLAPFATSTGKGDFMKQSTSSALPQGSHSSSSEDAILALVALGYRQNEAAKAVSKSEELLGVKATTEALVKAALG